MKTPIIQTREIDRDIASRFLAAGESPVMARLYSSRGVNPEESLLDPRLLPAKETLGGAIEAAQLLAEAIQSNQRIIILGDYDADGATSTALMLRALRQAGADVDFIVPNRFVHGYGISPLLARLAKDMGAEVIVTVDNGISAHAGIKEARDLSMKVVITDHHLQGETLPDADCIVNPNMRFRTFATRHLAGVGVAFYVLGMLREELKRRNHPNLFNLASMVDLVAVGTVGDLVRLDPVNRTLVKLGLDKIRRLNGIPGLKALLSITNRNQAATNAETAGFVLAPRINAAGRLQTADIGIRMLATDDFGEALLLAKQLDDINRERRAIQTEMTEIALDMVEGLDLSARKSAVVFEPSFHEGVVGLVASHLKERYSLPSAAFAEGEDGHYKGSFRSIQGVHVRDVLELVSKRADGLLINFGGHAMAAGGKVAKGRLDEFILEFDSAVVELAQPGAFDPVTYTDGVLASTEITYDVARRIGEENWGQGFPAPLFQGGFKVVDQRVVGNGHLKLKLDDGWGRHDAIFFGQGEPISEQVNLLYKLGINEYNGASSVQLVVEGIY